MSWLPIATAPRDGTLFDIRRRGIRFTDCRFARDGRLLKDHSYPRVTRWFLDVEDGSIEWMPRPDGLMGPYEMNEEGEKYVP